MFLKFINDAGCPEFAIALGITAVKTLLAII
jgi:hypothetical protein